MSDDLILFEEFENYAVISFNRPEKLNALSSPMVLMRGMSCSDSSGRIGVFPSEYF